VNVEVEYITLCDTSSSSATTAKASSAGKKPIFHTVDKEKIEALRAQIGTLQTLLVDEEVALELEEAPRHVASHRERTYSSESKLGNMKDERDYLLILRETIREEASDIARVVTNTEAEL
jgi:hypothetical protein